VAGRPDEVEACVNTQIDLILPARLLLLKHVRLVLVVQELDDGHPGVLVVHVIAEAGSVNDGEADCGTGYVKQRHCDAEETGYLPLKNFSSSSALVISISTVLSTCFWCRFL